jgi:hypothetical protein
MKKEDVYAISGILTGLIGLIKFLHSPLLFIFLIVEIIFYLLFLWESEVIDPSKRQ